MVRRISGQYPPGHARHCVGCGGSKEPHAKSCRVCRGHRAHGLSYTPEYRAWQTLRHRCTQDTNPAWKDYGGRGITVCARWLNSPANFLADLGPRPKGHELDRKENAYGYWCGKCDECTALGRAANCWWVTRSANDRNRRRNTLIEYQGRHWVLAELAQVTGVRADRISGRIKRGWSVEEAVAQVTFSNGTRRRQATLGKAVTA